MSFKEAEQVKFELNETITWGVKKDKFSGYSIPVALDDETMEKISDLASEHNTKNQLYGRTLYLKLKTLTEKQTKELLNKKRQHVMIHFKIKGIYTKGDNSYLTFKVTRLRKVDKPESDESCAED